MDKPIKDWTLSEAQEYCSEYRRTLSPDKFCEETDCELKKRGICCSSWVHDWNLNEFTQEEIDDAYNILRLFPRVISINRTTNALMVRYDEGTCITTIDYQLFPSIKQDQTINIKDIIDN